MYKVNNAIVISDLHCGCQYGLCPPTVILDTSGVYHRSKYQAKIGDCWNSFWDDWVPMVTRKEPYCVIINGDMLENRHHRAVTMIPNLADQSNIAYEMLAPVRDKCEFMYIIRGTEAHTGPSAELEEMLAKRLDAKPDENGKYSRFELYIMIGDCLVHCTHHIGTTSSMAYSTTALTKELTETFANCSRWGDRPPDIVVRSHRHIHDEIRVPTSRDYGYCFVSSGWQLKTPFTYRLPGGRIRTPTIGGSLIRQGDEEFFTRHRTWPLARPKTETPRIKSGKA